VNSHGLAMHVCSYRTCLQPALQITTVCGAVLAAQLFVEAERRGTQPGGAGRQGWCMARGRTPGAGPAAGAGASGRKRRPVWHLVGSQEDSQGSARDSSEEYSPPSKVRDMLHGRVKAGCGFKGGSALQTSAEVPFLKSLCSCWIKCLRFKLAHGETVIKGTQACSRNLDFYAQMHACHPARAYKREGAL
jgi:hypothetical protein